MSLTLRAHGNRLTGHTPLNLCGFRRDARYHGEESARRQTFRSRFGASPDHSRS